MLDVKVKPTEIRFGKYMFIIEVNLDGRFFPSRIFSVGFETETEQKQKQKHMKWRRIVCGSRYTSRASRVP